MGKRARRRHRGPARAAASPAKQAASAELHITVAAITDMHELDLRHETELVKAALLYADRVTLASPKVAFMASIASFTTLDRRQRIDAMAELMGILDDGHDAAGVYADLRRRRPRLTPHERVLLAGLEARLDTGSHDVAAKINELLDTWREACP
jgi:hypothetical protein